MSAALSTALSTAPSVAPLDVFSDTLIDDIRAFCGGTLTLDARSHPFDNSTSHHRVLEVARVILDVKSINRVVVVHAVEPDSLGEFWPTVLKRGLGDKVHVMACGPRGV